MRDSLFGVETSDTGPSQGPSYDFTESGAMKRDSPALIFVLALAAYALSCYGVEHLRPGSATYFDQLADSFLQGRLDLADSSTTYDLTEKGGRWYVPFPPLPALLLTPWVALMGLARANPLLLSIIMGALSVLFVSRLLDALAGRGLGPQERSGRRWLTLLFALGCVHWQVATDGAV